MNPRRNEATVELVDMFSARKLRNGISRQLEHRFGILPPQTRDKIEMLPAEFLEDLLVVLLDFKQISDADAWIDQYPQRD